MAPGERDKANAAAADAKRALANDPDKLRRLGDMIKAWASRLTRRNDRKQRR
jgi:hypothetical protein